MFVGKVIKIFSLLLCFGIIFSGLFIFTMAKDHLNDLSMEEQSRSPENIMSLIEDIPGIKTSIAQSEVSALSRIEAQANKLIEHKRIIEQAEFNQDELSINISLGNLRKISDDIHQFLLEIKHLEHVPWVSEYTKKLDLNNMISFSKELNYLFKDKITILVCFQNNAELRLGGGFIGSYAILEINNDKSIIRNIGSSYELDDFYNLKPAPDELKHLNQFLTFRDSNNSVFLQDNAEMARHFVQEIDGVIFIDSDFFLNFLNEFGSIENQGTEINKKNFYSSFIYLSDIKKRTGFLDNSEAKDFYKNLVPEVFNRLRKDADRTTNFLLNEYKKESIEYYFFNEELNIFHKRYPENFLEIFEANYSGSKSSKNISRHLTLNKICDDKLRVNWNFKYTHTGSVNYFDGRYIGSIVLLFPKHTNITKITGVDKSWHSEQYYETEVVDNFIQLTLYLNMEPESVYEFSINTESPASSCDIEIMNELEFVIKQSE
jgi:hypothetical protein